MTRLVLILALLWGPAWGQERITDRSDVLEIRASDDHFAEVFYSNGVSALSGGGRFTLTFDGVAVDIRVEVNIMEGGVYTGRERITVRPQSDLYVAIPESAEVEDGETITIQIMQPMF